MNHQTSSIPQIAYQSPQVSTTPMTESPLVDSSLAIPVFSLGDYPIACLNKAMAFLTAIASLRKCTQPKRPRNAAWYKDKTMLAEAQEAGQILDEEQLAFLADPRVPDGQVVQTIIPYNAAFQTKDLDTYNSDCDDILNAKVVLMTNISNYGSDVLSEVPQSKTYHNDMENQSVHAMHDFEQTAVVEVTDTEITSDSNIIPYSQYLQETQQANVQDTNLQAQQDLMILSVIEQMSKQIINHKAQRIKPNLYDGIVISAKHVAMPVIDDEETLILKEESRSKMSKKDKDLEAIKQNIPHKLIDYETLNILSNDFGKRFTPQQELSAEQAFWLRMSNPTSKSSNASPVIIEAPKELPKSSVDKQCLEIAKKELLLENDRLLQQIMSQDILLTVMNSVSLIGESVNMDRKRSESCDNYFNLEDESCDNKNALEILEFFKNNDLNAQFQDKDTTICKLKEIIKSMREKYKEENVNYDYCEIETKNMELENSVAKLISENERLCNEINHVKQDLLVYVRDTCPTAIKLNAKKVAVTSKNNVKKVRIEVFY
ncbi:hypothetical protein Tco_1096350 [Tanacetum coccineum]